ncbi:hypothetical protein niasHT_012851 [Heterodera trifolii]|uniref:MICOS complex subunit MIC60 n=1 Tax=Heterodera trifolii TaxID=157864 RepID=A0ABD2KYG9_9BILA
MSHPLWRRVTRIGSVFVLAGATGGAAYVGTHYVRHGTLPELPQWTQQFVDRMPKNVRSPNESASKQMDKGHRKSEFANVQRIAELEKQLAKQKGMEKQKIAQAVEEQRKLDESLSKMALEIERRRNREMTTTGATQTDHPVDSTHNESDEAELDAQLKRAALAHAEHLEQVIRTQKQIHDMETQQIVQDAIAIERDKFGKQIENGLVKLTAIEKMLKGRATKDLENRRAKLYWTICHSLTDALANGGTAQSQKTTHYKTQLLKQIAVLKKLTENDDAFAQSVCAHFPPDDAIGRGVPTEQGLVKRFDGVYKLASCTAQIGDEGGTLWRYVTSWLQSLFTFELPYAYSA